MHAAHLAAVVPAAVDQFTWNDTLGEDAALVVDVLEEQVDGGQTLCETALERLPFLPVRIRGSRSNGKMRSVPCSSP
jgi:hypothetical protein